MADYLGTSKGPFPPHFAANAHEKRVLAQLESKTTPIEKYIYLNGLKGREPHTFYRILIQNMAMITPILYTPTVGEACQKYSQIWRRPEGLYVSWAHRGRIREVIKTWPGRHLARIAVVTDGSRILGLGDLGANGLPICLGKLDLYIAGAGLRPSSAFPICVDLGTDNEDLLADPLYLGIRRKRPSDEEAQEFMEEFMSVLSTLCPHLLIQFEDFASARAFSYLALFRTRYRVFNDDIQGTGAVVLAGFLNAARLSGTPREGHRVVFYGAGSAGIGVARMLMGFFPEAWTEEERRARIWTVDSQGLIYEGRGGKLAEHKIYFARKDYTGAPLKKLLDIINYVKPTALIGLSTVRNAFDEEVVRAMAKLNSRPIIFPLSNPLTVCELDFEDALKWTNGMVIYSSGSPYTPVSFNGKLMTPGQGNNMYQFPAIGLGAVLCKARIVTDRMIDAAAYALATSLDQHERDQELVYPRLTRIREISAQIALGVMRAAQKDGVDEAKFLRRVSDAELLKRIKEKMWTPSTRDSHL